MLFFKKTTAFFPDRCAEKNRDALLPGDQNGKPAPVLHRLECPFDRVEEQMRWECEETGLCYPILISVYGILPSHFESGVREIRSKVEILPENNSFQRKKENFSVFCADCIDVEFWSLNL